MNKVLAILKSILGAILRFLLARKNVAVRFVFTLVFGAVALVQGVALLILTLFQFLWTFVTVRPLDAITSLSHTVTVYLYKMLRYITLNEADKPWPFGGFPDLLESPVAVDLTNPPVSKTTSETPEDESGADPTGPEETVATPAGEAEADESDTQEAIILDHKES